MVGLMVAEEVSAQTDSSSKGIPGIGQSSNQSEDPISLKTPPKVGVELYVAVAHLYVESGKFSEAEDQYRQAMKLAPNDVRVLLGYAMLKDRMNQPKEALAFYKQAQQKHPKDPSVYNNLAIHYARYGMVREAIEAGRRATDLRPREPRYRNNLAAIYVEAGMPQEAFKQFREIYDEPVAHYNLGFLLNKRGLKGAALEEFTIALRLSPGMTLARQWVDRLSQRGEGNPAAIGMAPPPRQAPTAVAFQPPSVPPPLPAPPSPPYYSNAAAGPVQSQYPVPPPAAPQFPAPPLADMPHYVRPQNVAPQFAGPPYQNPPPATNASPAGNGNTAQRLPPVNDPWNAANPNPGPQGAEVVAPNPPGWQR